MKNLIKFFFLGAIVELSLAKKCKDPNEEYSICGTACPLTCENKDNPPSFCTLQCVIGCFCKEGYVRNEQGKCVLPKDCRPKCGKNEQYSLCGANGCQNTCENPTLSQVCKGVCTAGCICKEGFLRDSNGKCVNKNDCRKTPLCGINEQYQECGTACPLTCRNKDNPPKFCTRQCISGCFCKRDYVRDCEGNCIRPTLCPRRKPNLCWQPLVTGECKASFIRWGYSYAVKHCIKFIYGGCQGNENNFVSEKECMKVCS